VKSIWRGLRILSKRIFRANVVKAHLGTFLQLQTLMGRLTPVLVAQIFNLLYRRLAVGKAVKNTGSFEISEIVIPSRGLAE
jgi:hypothetical protein